MSQSDCLRNVLKSWKPKFLNKGYIEKFKSSTNMKTNLIGSHSSNTGVIRLMVRLKT
jgi:hypothetical protein